MEDDNTSRAIQCETCGCAQWQFARGAGATSKSIPLPDGRWVEIKGPLERVCYEDAWSDHRCVLREPAYLRDLSRFVNAVIACGYCWSSGEGVVEFVNAQNGARMLGDTFDWNGRYIDRGVIRIDHKDPKKTSHAIEDVFGEDSRRAGNHLRAEALRQRNKLLEERLLPRMAFMSLARKIWLARAGYPEFLEPYAP